jgi:hypothetical protein
MRAFAVGDTAIAAAKVTAANAIMTLPTMVFLHSSSREPAPSEAVMAIAMIFFQSSLERGPDRRNPIHGS